MLQSLSEGSKDHLRKQFDIHSVFCSNLLEHMQLYQLVVELTLVLHMSMMMHSVSLLLLTVTDGITLLGWYSKSSRPKKADEGIAVGSP